MGATVSQITSLTIVYSTVYSDTDERKHQSSGSLAFVRKIHQEPVNSPHKWPETWKMFPFDDIIMYPSPTHLKLKYLEISFIHNIHIKCQKHFKFFTYICNMAVLSLLYHLQNIDMIEQLRNKLWVNGISKIWVEEKFGGILFLLQGHLGLTYCGLVTPYRHRTVSILVQVMACCLTAPRHYLNQLAATRQKVTCLNQCWLLIN